MDDKDDIVFRRPGRKRKQPRFELENSLQKTKKAKMKVLLAKATDVTYECHMPQCRKKFTSWVQFEKHQNDHDTQCKYCYKIFNNRKGLETHMIYFGEDHKPNSEVFECKICYREFVNEAIYKSHVESAHKKKDWIKLTKDLKSKLKKIRKKKRAMELIKTEPDSVQLSDVVQLSPNKSPEPLEQTAEVIEISDDEDGEIVCKSDCNCVICKGAKVRFCK